MSIKDKIWIIYSSTSTIVWMMVIMSILILNMCHINDQICWTYYFKPLLSFSKHLFFYITTWHHNTLSSGYFHYRSVTIVSDWGWHWYMRNYISTVQPCWMQTPQIGTAKWHCSSPSCNGRWMIHYHIIHYHINHPTSRHNIIVLYSNLLVYI